jgi:uncharacterized small protein (DUF1192 family)
MRVASLVTLAFLCGCGTPPAPDTADTLGEGDPKGPPVWWYTCGDPVCRGWTRDPTIPLCTTQVAGDPCRGINRECDIRNDGCNTDMICSRTDPTADGCPISRRSYKSDIRYLSPAEADAVRDDLLAMPLATWQYTAEGTTAASHLGFIIDDAPESPAVSESGETVDLYGYTSMTVAAVQAQQRQIDVLQAEVAALKAELAKRER